MNSIHSTLEAAQDIQQVGDIPGAIKFYSSALHEDPTCVAARYGRIDAYIQQGSRISLAAGLADAETAIAQDPEDPEGYFWKGITLRELGRWNDSEWALRKCEALTPITRRARVSAAIGELAKQRLESFASMYDTPQCKKQSTMERNETTKSIPNSHYGDMDKFEALEAWLSSDTDGNTCFPLLHMKKYGEGNRGVHMRQDADSETEIMSIDKKYLITVEMAAASPLGKRMAAATPPLKLSASKHCYTAIFILDDRQNPDSFFQPYYRILPQEYPNMPIFWSEEELQWLEGSYIVTQVQDRIRNIRADYEEIARVIPELKSRFTLHDFMWARMVVASRNFGISINGRRTDAMVPYADMLNHYRPRETKWTFNNNRQCFTITSIAPLRGGKQVYDSYGKKCNSRFLLNYGFAVEHNRDDDTGENHNEVRLVFDLESHDVSDPLVSAKLLALEGTPSWRAISVSTFYEHDGTNEAFSYLRFLHADSDSLSQLPSSLARYNLRRISILPFSLGNELNVLRQFANVTKEHLDCYPSTLEEDIEVLGRSEYSFGSNRRNSIVVVKGEKEICTYYIELYNAATELASLSFKDATDLYLNEYAHGNDDIDKYMVDVFFPLIRTAYSTEEEDLESLDG